MDGVHVLMVENPFLNFRYLCKRHSFFSTRTAALTYMAPLCVHLSRHREIEPFQWEPLPPSLFPARHRDERHEDPSSNSSPFAINFYSVTKNRLMARLSLPPTHQAQRDEQKGGKIKEETESECSYRLVRSPPRVWFVRRRKGRSEAEYITLRNLSV